VSEKPYWQVTMGNWQRIEDLHWSNRPGYVPVPDGYEAKPWEPLSSTGTGVYPTVTWKRLLLPIQTQPSRHGGSGRCEVPYRVGKFHHLEAGAVALKAIGGDLTIWEEDGERLDSTRRARTPVLVRSGTKFTVTPDDSNHTGVVRIEWDQPGAPKVEVVGG
jgi:hypothetical protein